ncbi:MAG: TolC family protein, partial [Candidatus Nitrotoga sp.]
SAFWLSQRIFLVTFIGMLALSANAYAAEIPLTLAEAQRRAIDHSRQLAAQDFSVAASRDLAVVAGQLPDPVLRIGIDNLPFNGMDRFSLTNDFMTMRRIGVMQEVTRADKRQLRTDRFEREAEKTVAEKSATAAAIERNTALAWLDRYYAEAMATVIAEQSGQAKLEIQAAEGAYRGGRGNLADIFAARGALAVLDDRASELQRRVRNAKTMLARWIGDAADMPLAKKPATDLIRLDPATLDTQLVHHPQIAMFTKQEEIAVAGAKLAQANKKSDWSVELAYQQRGSAFSDMVSIGVSIPLQWNQKNRQDRELSSKLALVEQAKAEREDMLRGHIAQTRVMINEWENNRERHGRYQRELIPLANARALATKAAYRGGKASLADVILARRNEIDVRIQALQLATDTDRLWAEINFLFPTNGVAAHAAMVMKDTK